MRHAFSLLAVIVAATVVSASLAAQAPASVAPAAMSTKALAPIPSARHFEHWGQIEMSYDDEENSTSIALTLPFDEHQRDLFARRGRGVSAVEMQVGFVFAGKMMTTPPEVATLVIKLIRPVQTAIDFDKTTVGDMHFVIDGKEPVVFSAPLVQRNAVNSAHGRVRDVQDTYAVVFTLAQFLRVVNGQKVTARMGDQIFDFTGGPLEAMREVASRIVVTP
jgi:hypothetical protein